MSNIIPYGRQCIDQDDIDEVVKVLKSNFLTHGPKIQEFEKKLCEYTGAKYAVSVANGTAGLHLAVKSLNLEPGFEGITTPNTFIASANCMIYNQGIPVLADIDTDTHNIDPKEIEGYISNKTKLIIPVDFAGHPCDMEEIYKIAKKHELFIIRDACHSIGALYKGNKTGNCKYADMTVFSFHPVKHITTGEGGVVLTNNKKLYDKLLLLRNHGIEKNPKKMSKYEGMWYYEMVDLGFNYRITDFQCAMGLSQLEKLENFVSKRKKIAQRYSNAFKDLKNLRIPQKRKGRQSSFHLYVVEIDFEELKISRQDFMTKLVKLGVGTQVHYVPIYLQPYYQKNFGYNRSDYPVSSQFYEKALSLPLYPCMSEADIENVIRAIRKGIN